MNGLSRRPLRGLAAALALGTALPAFAQDMPAVVEEDKVKAQLEETAKLAAENMVLGYHHAYGMPVTILRPFNTYGPYQRADGEGGVVSIFCDRADRGQMLNIYGDGTQTRDLLYVEDCARFVVDAGMHPAAEGRVLNAATGRDVTINELAKVIVGDESRIAHVKHIHPQSEIPKLLGNSDRARELIGWEPVVSLEEGIARTRNHLAAANTDEGTRAGAA